MKKFIYLLIFISFFIGSYFLIPKTVFRGWYMALALAFMFTFSLTNTCLIEHIIEKVSVAKKVKDSFLSIIAAVLGLSALQVCGPLCGVGIGIGIIATVFPVFFLNLIEQYSVVIIIISIIAQAIALYFMGCFKKHNKI